MAIRKFNAYEGISVGDGIITYDVIDNVGNVTANHLVVTNSANLGAVANVIITGGTLGYVLRTDGAGNLTWVNPAAAAVAGNNTEVQFNNSSSFGASANFTFDRTTNTLGITNIVSTNANVSGNVYLNNVNAVGVVDFTTATNVFLGNLAESNYFKGNGSLLTSITGGNVTGQVANALIAGTVYTNAQPNITSVGTLSSLSVTANISSGNANLGNLVTANYFSGNGSLLTSITGGNVTGQVANALISGTVYTNAQPNITSVGTLSSLNVTANISSGNANLGNLAIANFFSGDGSLLSNLNVANIGEVANANYAAYAGNVTIASQPNITSVGTLSSLSVTANVSAGNANLGNLAVANFFSGDGGYLSNLNVANIGEVANANYATYSGNVVNANQSNITSLGTLASLSITGNVTAGNASLGNLVTANYFSGNGNLITGLSLASSLTDVSLTSPNSGQILGYNGVNWVNVDNTSTVSAGAGVVFYFSTPVINAIGANTDIQVDTLSSTPNTSAQSYATVTVNGTAAMAAFVSAALNRTVFDAGNWDFSIWANVNNTGGTTTINCGVHQVLPNAGTVTVTGTGTSRTMTASGGTPFATVVPGSDVLLSSYVQTPNGIYRVTAKTSDTVITINTPTTYTNESSVTASVWIPLFNVGSASLISTVLTEYLFNTTQPAYNITTSSALGVLLTATTSALKTINVTINGTNQSSHFLTPLHTLHADLAGLQGGQSSEYYHLTYNEYSGTGTGNFVRQVSPQLTTPNIDSATGTSLVLTGNITSGNAHLGNLVTANYFTGDGSLLSNLNPSNIGEVANANYASYAGNVVNASQSNITSLGTLTSLSVTGNVSAGNANLGNLVVANFFSGNGSLLSAITGGNVTGQVANSTIAGTVYTNAQPNITSVGTLSSLSVTANISSGNANLGNLAVANFFSGDGGYLSNLQIANASVANANHANFAGNVLLADQPNITSLGTLSSLSVTANISSGNANLGNLATSNYFSGSGNLLSNIQGANVTGTVANANYSAYSGNITIANQPNITSLGTLVNTTLGASNSLTGGNLVSANYLAGTLTTTVQPNITSVGTLTSLSVSGNVSASNVTVTTLGNQQIAISLNGLLVGGPDLLWEFDNAALFTTALKSNGTISTTSNISSGNANLGNLAVANFFSGDGGFLSNLQISNGAVANANYATYAGNIVNGSQPNITSLGTLVSLDVTGNITSGNAGLGNLATANYFSGNGSLLTSITGGNVTGQVANALIAGTVYTNAQPNITSVGTLVSLNISGNITAGNANLGNLTVSNYFSGDGSLLSNITAGNINGQVANALVAGTVYTNAQPNITSVGTLSSLSVTGNITANNMNVTNDIHALNVFAGNLLAANYFQGDGSALSNVTSTSGNASYSLTAGYVEGNAQPNITSVGTLVSLVVSGNITSGNAVLGNLAGANYFSGDGSLLSNITGGNVTGQVANALVAGTVYTNAQPNITSVGTLTSLSVTGNISSGNANLGNLVTANYFSGNGSLLTSVAGGNVTGQVANALIAGTVYTNAQPNITSVGTLSSLVVSGNITSGNINGGNLVAASYFSGDGSLLTNVTGANVTGIVANANYAAYAGNVVNASQANITSLGTLSGLSVSGNATITGNLTVSGTTIYANVTTLNVKDPIIEMGGNPNGDPLTTNDGKDRGSLLHYYNGGAIDAFMGWDNSNAEFGFGSNVSVTNEVITWNDYGNIRASYFLGNASQLTGTIANANYAHYTDHVVLGAQPNITSVGTLTSLQITGNVTSNNAVLGNLVTANYFSGDGGLLSNINVANVGTVANSNYAAYAGNVTLASQPNITSLGTLTSLTVTGNVTSGNANLGNLVVANFFSGDGSLLSNLNVANIGTVANANYALYAGTVLTAAQPNITSLGTITNLTVSGNITSGNANLGNLVVANFFSGDGGYLSNLQISSGTVANANYANYAGNVVNSAQSNITSLGTLSGLTSTGTIDFVNASNVSLGAVGNIHITGGNDKNVLQTNGSGALSWGALSAAVDVFTGNGVQTDFGLSVIPASKNLTMINYNGAIMLKADYTLTGNTVSISSAPANGSKIEVTTFYID